ncbi:15318_t:CDS:1, partial [Funneliformis geosporum]
QGKIIEIKSIKEKPEDCSRGLSEKSIKNRFGFNFYIVKNLQISNSKKLRLNSELNSKQRPS